VASHHMRTGTEAHAHHLCAPLRPPCFLASLWHVGPSCFHGPAVIGTEPWVLPSWPCATLHYTYKEERMQMR
jgi:hypothetical protein